MKVFILSVITVIIFFFAMVLITWKHKHYQATIIIEDINFNKDTVDIEYKGSLHLLRLYGRTHLVDVMDSLILPDINHYRVLKREQINQND